MKCIYYYNYTFFFYINYKIYNMTVSECFCTYFDKYTSIQGAVILLGLKAIFVLILILSYDILWCSNVNIITDFC